MNKKFWINLFIIGPFLQAWFITVGYTCIAFSMIILEPMGLLTWKVRLGLIIFILTDVGMILYSWYYFVIRYLLKEEKVAQKADFERKGISVNKNHKGK